MLKMIKSNGGFTLAEVLISSFIFAIVAMIFTTGLFMVIRVFGAADDTKTMERAAEEIMLAERTTAVGYLDAARLEYNVTPATAATLQIGAAAYYVNGKKTVVSVKNRNGFDGDTIERVNFIIDD